ncbi:hypothetical protein CBA19CS22_00670 [Caballeronia novacaledonica]|uniref:Uncharacterized protein n=1 Tax=Caballeronia novacaledonica TaxID=1544861 RepID=A0ACB5QJ78_9BURK|nr:hypothetical protein CBA19CS22_00670 [Caballeronia novacaledonica]
MSARDLQPALGGADLLHTGRFFIGPMTTDQSNAAKATLKICIGCGARQLPDGSLPCGHDNDL